MSAAEIKVLSTSWKALRREHSPAAKETDVRVSKKPLTVRNVTVPARSSCVNVDLLSSN